MTAIASFRTFRRSMREPYAAAFQRWAVGEALRMHALYPERPPFPLQTFDGCTLAPEVCRPCCLMHDMQYWFNRAPGARRRADDELRRCIIEIAQGEDRIWRWLWHVNGWTFWAAVRLFGGKYR